MIWRIRGRQANKAVHHLPPHVSASLWVKGRVSDIQNIINTVYKLFKYDSQHFWPYTREYVDRTSLPIRIMSAQRNLAMQVTCQSNYNNYGRKKGDISRVCHPNTFLNSGRSQRGARGTVSLKFDSQILFGGHGLNFNFNL